MGKNINKNIIVKQEKPKINDLCNSEKYLKFNFSFTKENGEPSTEDAIHLIKRLSFLSSKIYGIMVLEYQGDKKNFIEDIPVKKMKWRKEIPSEFREIYPAETNEKYSVFRIYPAGTPAGTANPRIIGMIKNTIFYVFYIDWKGNLYDH